MSAVSSPRNVPAASPARAAALALAACGLLWGCGPADGPETEAPSPEMAGFPIAPHWQFEEARQFDFWVGTWDVNLRIQQDDLSWKDDRRAEARIYPILDGRAILELWNEERIKGFSLRYFDPPSNRWHLWLNWPSPSRSGLSQLEGTFRHGRGEFDFEFVNPQGQEVIARYTFSDIGPDRLRWDDAHSTDGGRSWSGNWIMEFSRTAAQPPPFAGVAAHTWETGERCEGEEYRLLERLAGDWTGKLMARDAAGDSIENSATLRGYKILDGCAVMTFLEHVRKESTFREFAIHSYNSRLERIESGFLDVGVDGLGVFLGEVDENRIDLRDSSEPDADDATHRILIEFVSADDLRLWWQERSDPGAEWATVASGELGR